MRTRTGYSFRSAVGFIDDVISRLKETGSDVAPISDRASTFGFVNWRKAAVKAGLRPIFGVELAVTDSINAKKPAVDFWTFWPKDDVGIINDLVQNATNQFKWQPLLTYEQAMAATGVIKIAGHRPCLEKMAPSADLYIAMAPSLARGLYRKAKALGYQFIACSDNYFPRQDDKGLYEIICGRGASTQTYVQHILTNEEWNEALSWIDETDRRVAIANRDTAIASCHATLRQGELLKPLKSVPLRDMCVVGAAQLGINLNDPIYAARLDKELALIEEKKFEDYFYIIADLLQWARGQMICGPARGSSCGSLVCYLLKITTIDPIPFDLIFERFIDTTRSDLPDIDLDFSDTRRDLVFDYMINKYGRERVARLGNVNVYRPRSAIAEAGAALDIPKWKTDKILESLVERSSGDSRALQIMEDTFNDTPQGIALIEEFPEFKIVQRMEGHPRHSSQHAAGIVLTQEAVTRYIAIDSRTGAAQCDKKDAEDLNLLKIDALGLTQLSVFEDTLSMAGLPMAYLDTVPLDDQSAFDVINKGSYSGIFQYEGQALQSIANVIRTNSLEDIVSTTALARPGPMASGGTTEWIKRKRGDSPIVYQHQAFEPYLRNTMGIVAYQEQVMQIGREIGDLSWEDVTALRKAMSKSLGKEFFDKYGDRWKEGARKKGIPNDILDKIWDDLCAYGSWAFNRSHSVAYGLVSYWCCYLKAHFPFEFAAATLQHETDPAKQIQLLREMHKEGVDYIPVDKELSTDKWQAATLNGKKFLVGPVQNVRGIGPKMVQMITSARARGEPITGRAAKLLDNPKTNIDSLWPIRDAIKRIMPDPTEKNIYSAPVPVIEAQLTGQEYDVMVFGVASSIKPKDENEPVRVAKRGRKLDGPTKALNLWIRDDTDLIYCQVDRWQFERMGREIVERGKPNKALYAVKGSMPKGFRMIRITHIRYIGDIDE